ncbi:hypothetical protein CEY15_08975 [Dietzia natronolimnaea]|uniref:Uncharacterized protein n=1 Tax=Dietzia natronolimnaea TaxID=161920 RepID=A0A2A2WQG7_9ACTN|nr:hypothetical protein [Dietzia natronolimnaea]PAY23430.1 hypothetical protein CEY15_08975 [Dietzia natronolimnaea]
MRLAAVGLIAVLAGGVGVAAAAVVLGPVDTPAPPVDEVADQAAEPRSDPLADSGGTLIEGSRPHLTVRSGMPSVMLAGTIPGFLALLPASASTLPTLAPFSDATGGPGTPLPARRAGPSAVTPGVGSPTSTSRIPAPAPDGGATSAPSAAAPRPPAVGGPAILSTDVEVAPVAVPPAVGAPPMDRPPPPHAAGTGRPDHAGTTGPPAHAAVTPRGDGPPRDSSRTDARPTPG